MTDHEITLYRQKCKELGIEPSPLRQVPLSFIEMKQQKETAPMTRKEAAEDLGVGKGSIDTYLSKGKLKGDGDGGVDDKSIEEYKAKREEGLQKRPHLRTLNANTAPAIQTSSTTEYGYYSGVGSLRCGSLKSYPPAQEQPTIDPQKTALIPLAKAKALVLEAYRQGREDERGDLVVVDNIDLSELLKSTSDMVK